MTPRESPGLGNNPHWCWVPVSSQPCNRNVSSRPCSRKGSLPLSLFHPSHEASPVWPVSSECSRRLAESAPMYPPTVIRISRRPVRSCPASRVAAGFDKPRRINPDNLWAAAPFVNRFAHLRPNLHLKAPNFSFGDAAGAPLVDDAFLMFLNASNFSQLSLIV